MAQIESKDHYAELTDKQQRVVDELADDPTAQNTEIAERAGVSRSTVYNVKEHYSGIVEAQLNRRGRHDGEETTEGDPFNGQLEFKRASQVIGDRPTQPATSDGGEVAVEATGGDAEGVTVELDRETVQGVIKGEGDDEVRAAVVEAVVAKAFAPAT